MVLSPAWRKCRPCGRTEVPTGGCGPRPPGGAGDSYRPHACQHSKGQWHILMGLKTKTGMQAAVPLSDEGYPWGMDWMVMLKPLLAGGRECGQEGRAARALQLQTPTRESGGKHGGERVETIWHQ